MVVRWWWRQRFIIKHLIGSTTLSCVVGVLAWANFGHPGHDIGAGIAGFFVGFAITFIGPNGLEVDDR